MLANIRDGVLSYSDLCVQHPEFENLAYSIYCSVYVSEHTHDAVLQLADRLRRQDFLCEYMQESEYIYMLQIFLSDKENYSISEVVLRILLHSKTNIHFCTLKISFLLQPTGSHITPAACTF